MFSKGVTMSNLFHFEKEALWLLVWLLLVLLPYAVSRVFKGRVLLVVIQIGLGIIMGPAILGRFAPEISRFLFNDVSKVLLDVVSFMALTFFGFQTGAHFNVDDLKGRGKAFTMIGLASILGPFAVGVIFALTLSASFHGKNANWITFALGIGIATGVTALPVLAAMLKEMHRMKTSAGQKALGYATFHDVILWTMVSILLVLTGKGGWANAGVTALGSVIFLVVMVGLVRPWLQSLADRGKLTDRLENGQRGVILAVMAGSALFTELVGLHFMLGAFVAGIMLPKHAVSEQRHSISAAVDHRLEVAMALLIPFFFMKTGLDTNFDVGTAGVWILFGMVTLVAMISMVSCTAVSERLFGASWKEALTVGVFMQSKGLMEVVILKMLHGKGVISSECFAAMLLMALTTTALTKPLVSLVDRIFHATPDATTVGAHRGHGHEHHRRHEKVNA